MVETPETALLGKHKTLKQMMEEKFKVIEDKLSEFKDLQIINKLDIINLKNTIEKLKLSGLPVSPAMAPPPAPPKTAEPETVSLPKDAEKKIKELGKRVEALEKKPVPSPVAPAKAEEAKPVKAEATIPASQLTRIDSLEKELKELSERISGLKPIKIPEGVKDIDTYKSMIEGLKKEMESVKGKANESEELKELRNEIDVVKKRMKEIREKPEKPEIPAPPAQSVPPAPKDFEDVRRKANQSLMSIKNMMDYVKANELHIDEIEKRISGLTKKGDAGELNEFKKELKAMKEKMEELEQAPIIPPLSSLPKKGMGRVLGKIHELEDRADQIQKTVDKEKKESLTTQAQIATLFKDVKINKEKTESLETADVKTVEKEIYRRVEKLRDMIGEAAETGKKHEERVDAELKSMRRGSEQVRIIREMLEKMDIEGISRELESLKAKTGWLEQKIAKLDVNMIYEKIKEIEEILRGLKASSPYVIE